MDENARVDAVEGGFDVKEETSSKGIGNEAGVDSAGENRELIGAGFSLSETELESGGTEMFLQPPVESMADHPLEHLEERLGERNGAKFARVTFRNKEDNELFPRGGKFSPQVKLVEDRVGEFEDVVW